MIDRGLNFGRLQLLDLARGLSGVSNILDIGAGPGADLANLRMLFPEAKMHALESYPENIKALEALGINVYGVDIEKAHLPFDNESIDLVITNQFLEHTKEFFWIMHEVSRVLKPGGALLIGVPNLASLHNRLLLLIGRQPTCIQVASAHVRGFTRQDLIDGMNKIFPGGYKVTGFRGCNFYPFPRWAAVPLAKVFPNFAWGMTFRFSKEKAYGEQFIEYPVNEKLETNYYLGR